MSFWPNRKSVKWNTVSCKNDIICDITCSGLLVLVHQYRKQTQKGVYNYVRLYTSTHYHQQMYRCSNHHYCKLEGPTVSKHYLHKRLNLVKAHSTLQVFWDGPGGMKENVTALLWDEVPQIFIRTLNEVSIQCSYIVHSSNDCCVICSSWKSVHCTREGSAKDFTTLHK